MTVATLPIEQRIITKIEANPALVSRKNLNRPLNVAAYCRVSTDDEDQLNSYRTQVTYYTEHISKNPKWRFVDVYADEGITGTNTKKREEFLRMIKDCEKGKIDMILTKSVARFARNTVDTISYVRKLKALGIGVFFEEQNIDSLKEDSETYIGIYGVMAQSESENISANVKWGIHKRMQNGTYACRLDIFGFRKNQETGEYYIVPEEAETVKKIFQMYLDGSSLDQIKTYLESNRIPTRKGKEIWSKDVIKHMLQNEKYVGDVLFQKTFRVDCISKRTKINRGEMTKYLVSNNHTAIIDRDTFRMVQSEISRRSSKRKISDKGITEQGKYSGKYALSELLVCAECGSPFRRRTWTGNGQKKIYWRCLSRIEHGTKYCSESKGIEEEKLKEAICRAVQKAMPKKDKIVALIKSNLAYAVSGEESVFDVYSIEKQIKELQVQIEDTMKLSLRSGGNAEKYEEEIAKMYGEIKVLREQLKLAEIQMQNNGAVTSEINRICELLEKETTAFETYNEIVLRRLVDCIRITKEKQIIIVIKGGIEITENIENAV